MAQATEKLRSAEDFIAEGHTPMMAQYMAVKEKHPDCLVFYRMGDFYELFFEDAVTASAVLDITLTKRGKNQGEEIHMAGVPFHSYEPYLARLIRAGYKVALCEQTETPEEAKKRGGPKALVNRDVVRVVTQGTLTEDSLLESRENNYLSAIAEVHGQLGVAWIELSTGEFNVQPIHSSHIQSAIERIQPREILVAQNMQEDERYRDALAGRRQSLTVLAPTFFASRNAQKRLEDKFGVGTLESFGAFSTAEIAAAGALLDYIERTQIGKIPHLRRPRQLTSGDIMEIDAATRRNLELTRTLSGERKGSLLACIDRTVTSAGARLLQTRVCAPLTDPSRIQNRLGQVETLLQNKELHSDLTQALQETPDMARALARLTGGRGGPRDLGALRAGLRSAEVVLYNSSRIVSKTNPLRTLLEKTRLSTELKHYSDHLARALQEEMPFLARDGGFVAGGYSPRLDELRLMRDESRRLMASLQKRYQDETSIDALKITFNNMLGYFIEVPAKRADKLMVRKDGQSNPFIHRQTTASAVRFTTPELAELERDIAQAAERALALEKEIFDSLVAETAGLADEIALLAQALAALDVAASLAALAEERRWVKPVIDASLSFEIRQGRHPVVEAALKERGEGAFVPNDSSLGQSSRLWLLTGPNMAGKSTFLRQNALIPLLAQMGSFVPAEFAHIGVIDRLFSRVGASDDLASGRSTFMVEMVETASILNQATEKSLVILDEIGRGTATFDGLSIAWACVEHLHEVNRCRGLFATHYHELTVLKETLPRLSCHSMQVRQWKGDVIFLHSVGGGSADQSYGIHVAKIAGLPPAVIDRAGQVLKLLQKDRGGKAAPPHDLPLFMAAPPPAPVPVIAETPPLLAEMRKINPDTLSPRDALDIIYRLKELANDTETGNGS